MKEGRRSELSRRCWEEVRPRGKSGRILSKWEEERKRFFEDRGIKEEGTGGEGEIMVVLVRKEMEMYREERWAKIRVKV